MEGNPMRRGRREFLRLLVGAASWPVVGCGPGDEATPQDRARLADQRRLEAGRSGQGPYGDLRFQGYRGLARLPWFELDPNGNLRLAVEIPPAFDVHAHLGMALLFAPELDLAERTERVQHLLDCDADPACELDLDVYVNTNFGESAFGSLRWQLARQFLWGNDAAATHTIPNLLGEMDRMGVAGAAILPIAFGLPFGDDLTDRWMDAIQETGAGERLLPGCSVHPRDPDWRDQLAHYVRRGARVLKFHPAGQRCFPDAPEAMEIFAECERLSLPVVFHAGRAGIEPEAGMNYNLMRHYAEPLTSFPRLPFVLGHAGARDVAEAAPLAIQHENVWLGTHGQSVTSIHELLDSVGPDKLLFGSDWPWYHLGASLAKLLIVTEGKPEARRLILEENAARVLGREPARAHV
jgi:hypothetical protein